MNSTITELSVHACNFVLKILDREEPKARVWPKMMSKLQDKIAIFQNFSIFTCLLALLTYLYHYLLQSPNYQNQLRKIRLIGLLNFWNKHFMSLSGDAKQNFSDNSLHKQTKLSTRSPYSVFVKELLKPNQFCCLEIPQFLPYNCFKKAPDKHNKHSDFNSKTNVNFYFKFAVSKNLQIWMAKFSLQNT